MDSYENPYSPNEGRGRPRRRRTKLLWLIPAVLLAALLIFDSFYTLTEDQYAVLTTFGKPTTVSASGLQPKLPLWVRFVRQIRNLRRTLA